MVSIIDCERLRRLVIKQKSGEAHMGYELFYDWLRLLAQFVFHEEGAGGRRALHQLLTQYIIPFASKMGDSEQTNRSKEREKKPLPLFSSGFLNVLMEYSHFFLYSYYFILVEENVSAFSYNSCVNIWPSIMAINNGILTSKRALISAFRAMNILPTLLSEEQLNLMLSKLNQNRTTIKSDFIELTFMQYLWLLDSITQPNIEPEMTANNNKMTELKTLYVVRLVQIAAEKLLLSTISRFSHRENSSVTASSFLWLMRQARFTLADPNLNPNPNSTHINKNLKNVGDFNDSIPWLLEQIEHYAEPVDFSKIDLISATIISGNHINSSTNEEERFRAIKTARLSLSANKLLYILFRIVEKRLGHPVSSLSVSFPYIAAASTSMEDKYCLYLTAYCPLLLFASAEYCPHVLEAWYDASAVWRYQGRYPDLLRHFEGVVNSSLTSPAQMLGLTAFDRERGECLPTHFPLVPLSAVKALLTLKGIYPLLLPDLSIVDLLTEQILGRSPNPNPNWKGPEVDKDDVWIPQDYLLELFFCLSRTEGLSWRLSQQAGDGFEVLVKLLSLASCDDLTALFPARPLAPPTLTSSPSKTPNPNPNPNLLAASPSGAVGTAGGSSPAGGIAGNGISGSGNGMSGVRSSSHRLSEVLFLLLHFPVPSYSLNPWDMARLAFSSSSSSKGEGHADSEGDEASPAEARADLIHKFCASFSVDRDSLSAFFEVFYSNNSGKDRDRDLLNLSVLERIMTERVLRLLYLNNDLLKFEYSRCLARFKVPLSASQSPSASFPPPAPAAEHPNPSNSGSADWPLVPFPSGDTMESRPRDTLLPLECALAWGKATLTSAHCHPDLIHKTLQRIAFISQSRFLTFSTFILFAVQIFYAEGCGRGLTQPISENDFVGVVRKMLHTLALALTGIQQSLRMRVLGPLFRVSHAGRRAGRGPSPFPGDKTMDPNEKHSVLVAAVDFFSKSCIGDYY